MVVSPFVWDGYDSGTDVNCIPKSITISWCAYRRSVFGAGVNRNINFVLEPSFAIISVSCLKTKAVDEPNFDVLAFSISWWTSLERPWIRTERNRLKAIDNVAIIPQIILRTRIRPSLAFPSRLGRSVVLSSKFPSPNNSYFWELRCQAYRWVKNRSFSSRF